MGVIASKRRSASGGWARCFIILSLFEPFAPFCGKSPNQDRSSNSMNSPGNPGPLRFLRFGILNPRNPRNPCARFVFHLAAAAPGPLHSLWLRSVFYLATGTHFRGNILLDDTTNTTEIAEVPPGVGLSSFVVGRRVTSMLSRAKIPVAFRRFPSVGCALFKASLAAPLSSPASRTWLSEITNRQIEKITPTRPTPSHRPQLSTPREDRFPGTV